MKTLKQRTLGVCILLACFMLLGCSGNKVYKIAVSQCSEDDWRTKLNDEIRREMMFHEDAEVEIRSADDSSEKQIADIRYFLDNDFDILIVSPNEATALTPIINKVYERGIPVVIFDRNIQSDSYTARIGVDDAGLGRSVAHYARHLIPGQQRALEIYGLPGSTPAKGRHEGFVREFAEHGGTLLASVPANWRKEDAERVTDSLLQCHPDVNLIFAHNDRMAIGASEVARRRGLRDIRIIGIDAVPNIGIQAVADSVIDATFFYPTEGHRLIRTALAILKGEPFKRETVLPATSAVDLTNADILLMQNEMLREETDKMGVLKRRIDDYWEQHSSQTSLFYASILIIVLLFGVVFLILRTYWQHKKHQKELLEQNKELEKQRDMQRSLNERLEASTQSKLIFFTNVSHDLRTPLTLISEPIAQLVKADNLTAQQQTLMRIADKNVRILRRLINQILDFRKYENNKLELNLTEIDFGETIVEWMDAFYSLARKRHLHLSLKTQEGTANRSLAVDVEKMERVFFNLISNAFKYTPDNGDITVSYTMDEASLVLSVADTGEGISARDMGNIFDRFFQVERVHPNGSGIGLSLSKAFVELHGGNITVDSELQKGSVFTVTLPVRHVEKKQEVKEMKLSGADVEAELDVIDVLVTPDGNKPLVLVIDDNRDIQELLTELLGTDYAVITASNGSEGIRKAVKYIPDLVICDVMMPVMDGLECCRRLKAEELTSHIPVLMLTACSMDEQRVQGYGSGADGYLPKPFSTEVLLSRCASLIENRKRIKEVWLKADVRGGAEPAKAKPVAKDMDSEFYNRFLEVFQPEMGNSDLNVNALASKMGLERTQFYRKIKSLTNYSPVELIKVLRLKRAQLLLKTTDKTISEVAYETGFTTPAYFTRCYRENFGETPTETRANL